MPDNTTATDELLRTVKEMRDTLEKKSKDPLYANSGEYIEKMAKMHERLDTLQDDRQKDVEEALKRETIVKELTEQVGTLEKRLSTSVKSDAGDKNTLKEKEAFLHFFTKGLQYAPDTVTKYLRTDVNTQGGYLAPPEFVAEIIKGITEISDVRKVARIRRTAAGQIEIPKRTGTPTAVWVKEGGVGETSQSTYGMESIQVNDLRATVVATNQMLTDSEFNMETEINDDVIEQMNAAEGAAYVNGDGVEKPFGFVNNPAIQLVPSTTVGAISGDDILNLAGALKQGYNPIYAFNRSTRTQIRELTDTNGQYLWATGLAVGNPDMLAGYPFMIFQDMADVASGSKPVVFGDFFRGYTIVDKTGMTIIRDPYSLADQGKVRFLFFRRTGGQVVQAEALKLLQISS